ncbi:MAG: hypothetical protein RIR87_1127 [Actinomycetota bacterium]|jgi:hypothetical protein
MAVTPVVSRRSDEVMQRLTRLRNGIDRLVASVRDGHVSLSDVFAIADRDTAPADDDSVPSDGEVASFVYLVKVAEAVPGVGKVRARRILEEHGLGERTRVGAVPRDVRAALVAAFS